MSEQTVAPQSHWILLSLSLVAATVNVFLPLVLVRVLSPEEIGQFKIFFLYLSIAPMLSFTPGIISGLPYWAGQNRDRRDRAYQVSFLLACLCGVALTLLVLAGRAVIQEQFGWSEIFSLLFALSVFTATVGTFFEEVAISAGHLWHGSLFYASFEMIRAVLIVSAVWVFGTLESVLWAHLLVSVLKVLMGVVFGMQLGLIGFTWESQIMRDIWRYALPVSFAALFSVAVQYTDQLILSTSITPSEFAFYAIGCLSLAPIFLLEQSVTRIAIPQMAGAFSRGDEKYAQTLYARAVDQLAFYLIPTVVVLMVFCEPIITLLFTPTYTAASRYLEVFALSYLALIVPFDAVQRARGEGHWIFRTYMGCSALSLVLTLLLVYQYGAMGALLALVSIRLAMRGYSLRYVARTNRWKVSEFIPLYNVMLYAGIAVLLGLAAVCARMFFHSTALWFFVCGTLVGVLFPLIALNFQRCGGLPTGSLPTGGQRKVLLVTQHLSLGGLERVVVELARELKRAGRYDPVVFSYDHAGGEGSSDLQLELRNIDVPVIAFKKGRGFSVRTVFRLFRTVLTEEVHIVHSHNLGSLLYASFVKLVLPFRIRLVHTQHTFVHLSEVRRYWLYEKVFSRVPDELIAVSPEIQAQYVEARVSYRAITVIPNGVRFTPPYVTSRRDRIRFRQLLLESMPPEHRNTLAPMQEACWILYLARLYSGKGHQHALTVWQDLPEEIRKKAALLFVGPEGKGGEVQNLLQRCAGMPDKERVVYVGPSFDPSGWYRSADVFLSCSEWEGMPLSPIEALGYGVPALLSEIPGHAFLKAYSEQFPLDDLSQGVRVFTEILAKLNYTQELAQERAFGIRERFSVGGMVSRYMELYG